MPGDERPSVASAASADGAAADFEGSAANLRVERFRSEASEWDAFVRGAESWTHPHLHGWRDVVADVFGHDCPYLAARGPDGRLSGVLPLVRVRSVLFGDFLVSVPFLNYGGALGEAPAVRALTEEAARLADAEGVDLLELRSRTSQPLGLSVSHRKITMVMDLPEDAEVLWKDLDSKVRSQVRRPRKAEMSAAVGPEQLDAFYRVFSQHMRDLGTPVMPRAFFQAVADRFGEDVRFAAVYTEGGKPVAVGCALRWADELELTWASDLFDYRRDAPNMLLYWTLMERAIEEGCRTFNFGRCTPGSGTHRFKSQWGSRDEQLHWYQHGEGADATPSPDDGAYAWGPKVWRKLPLPLANLLGPRIVKYIP